MHECRRDGILADRYVVCVYEFLNSPAIIAFARAVTGIDAIDHADGHVEEAWGR